MLQRTSSDALLKAAVRNSISGQWALVHATDAPKNHDYLCHDCMKEGYETHLLKKDATAARNPSGWHGSRPGKGNSYLDRFDLARGQRHYCEHPVRSLKLRQMGFDYGAQNVDNDIHTLDFEVDILPENSTSQSPNHIHTAERLAKLSRLLAGDPGLRERQSLVMDGMKRPFHDAVFCHSDTRQLYERVLGKAAGEKLKIGMIFRPIGLQTVIMDPFYRGQLVIPGMPSGEIKFCGVDLKPSVVLACKNREIYGRIRKIIDKDTKRSLPLFVVGSAAVNLEGQRQRVQDIRDGVKVPHAAFVTISVHDMAQVTVWKPESKPEMVREMPKRNPRLQNLAVTIG